MNQDLRLQRVTYRDALRELLQEKALEKRAKNALENLQSEDEAIKNYRRMSKSVHQFAMDAQRLRGRQSPPLRPCLYTTDKIKEQIQWYRQERLELEAYHRQNGIPDWKASSVIKYLEGVHQGYLQKRRQGRS